MSVRIEKLFSETVKCTCGLNKLLYELLNISIFKQLAELINHVIKCFLFVCFGVLLLLLFVRF